MPKSSDFTRDDFRKKFSDALKTNDEEGRRGVLLLCRGNAQRNRK